MKLLLWHCKYIGYRDKRRSTRPEELRGLTENKSSAQFTNVLAVFTCIESGDKENYVEIAVREILANLEMIRSRKNVVIIPFVHMSSEIAQPKDAIRIIRKLIKSLGAAGVTVHEASFGFHKDFELHYKGYGHPGSVCFRSIPYKRGENADVSV